MRNILEKVRKRDYDEVKTGAQAIYLAEGRAHAEAAFRRFRARWLREYGPMVRHLERDLPELLSVFAFPRHLWRKLRTTNVIERCFVEVRRAEPGPWCALSTCKAWTASSTPSSRDSTWNGKPAPSTYLHKQLDVTYPEVWFTSPALRAMLAATVALTLRHHFLGIKNANNTGKNTGQFRRSLRINGK
jgi:Transposase, Mutator family